MANIKSAKKRILVNRTKAERNKSIRSAVKTAIKKVEVAVVNKDRMTFYLNFNQQIPSWAAVYTRFTLFTNTDALSVVNTGRDRH